LVELLITLAVLGSLVAVASVSLISFQHQVTLQQAATQFATDLTLARSKARRSSVNWEVAIINRNQYRLGDSSTRSSLFSLPAGVRFDAASLGSIVFEAPYGLVSSAPVETLLEGKGGRRLRVNIVGLGGKVVVRAAPNAQ
jgi:Tfp pilus assembly protein FimT